VREAQKGGCMSSEKLCISCCRFEGLVLQTEGSYKIITMEWGGVGQGGAILAVFSVTQPKRLHYPARPFFGVVQILVHTGPRWRKSSGCVKQKGEA